MCEIKIQTNFSINLEDLEQFSCKNGFPNDILKIIYWK